MVATLVEDIYDLDIHHSFFAGDGHAFAGR